MFIARSEYGELQSQLCFQSRGDADKVFRSWDQVGNTMTIALDHVDTVFYSTFSPEGRLFQVEYSLEAIKLGSTAIGVSPPSRAATFAPLTNPQLADSYRRRRHSRGRETSYIHLA